MKTQDRESREQGRYNNQRKRINRIRFIMENWHRMTIKQRIKYFLRYSSGIYIHVTGKLFVDLFIHGFNSTIAEIKSRRQIDEDDQILHPLSTVAIPQPKLEELEAEMESYGKGGAGMREPYYRVWVNPLNTFLPIASIDFYSKEVRVWYCGNEDCGLCDEDYKFDEVDLVPYTGIDTAEGEKVFKNDIFGYFEANSDKPICYGVVKYRNDYDQYRTHNPCGYVMEWQLNSKVAVLARNLREDLPFWCDSYSNAKKVGNIYENPELLEVQE